MEEKDLNVFKRFWIYQKERFSLFSYGIMITTFAFSAMSYSKILRGVNDFSWLTLLVGAITSVGFFFLLRIFDEFKDAEDDAKYRPYRAVPRGLVSFKELKILALIIIAIQLILNFIFIPKMLWIWCLVMIYMLVMAKEFFVRDWLRHHPIVYLVSHMLVMPVIDFYTTGLDWEVNLPVDKCFVVLNNCVGGIDLPKGLIFFLVVTFLNGVVIEIGRKIRAKDAEEFGVETYSYLWGEKGATITWLCVLFTTFVFANIACCYAGFGKSAFIFLVCFLIFCAFPAFQFLKNREQKTAAKLETMAGIWTLGMYLSLGGVPMGISMIKNILVGLGG